MNLKLLLPLQSPEGPQIAARAATQLELLISGRSLESAFLDPAEYLVVSSEDLCLWDDNIFLLNVIK